MKIIEVKKALEALNTISFTLPNGTTVPSHFHLTEIGKVEKHFIDCGGTERQEQKVSFQLWTANDTDHRLASDKMKNIIELGERKLGISENAEVEVEYQGNTIEKYALEFDGTSFQLQAIYTDCLAKEQCGIPENKPKRKLSELGASATSCQPGSGCC